MVGDHKPVIAAGMEIQIACFEVKLSVPAWRALTLLVP